VHVIDAVDRDSDLSDFTGRERIIGIQTDLRREIKRDAQTGRALREQIFIPSVRFLRSRESGVLTHRPELSAIHVRTDATRVGELARSS
jgi:hypothetical protein